MVSAIVPAPADAPVGGGVLDPNTNPRATAAHVRPAMSTRNLDFLLRPGSVAVLCAPPETVPRVVEDLGARGSRGVILLTHGRGRAAHDRGRSVLRATLDEARPYLVRIPGALGESSSSFRHWGATRAWHLPGLDEARLRSSRSPPESPQDCSTGRRSMASGARTSSRSARALTSPTSWTTSGANPVPGASTGIPVPRIPIPR